jgi:hypothetical protein
MSIRINGTDVITDTRALANISNLRTINGNSILGSGDISTTATVTTTANGLMSSTDKVKLDGLYTGVIDVSGSVRSNVTTVAALDVNCSLGNYFIKTISANSSFTFSNVPASRAYSFTIEITHTAGSIAWPTSVQWPGTIAPTLTTGKTHLFIFITDDGGTRWRGAALTDYNN